MLGPEGRGHRSSHRGRRSEFNRQRRFVKQVVSESSRIDRVRSEKICMLDGVEVSEALKKRFTSVVVGASCFEKGEVIVDARGRGSLQVPDDYLEWVLAIE